MTLFFSFIVNLRSHRRGRPGHGDTADPISLERGAEPVVVVDSELADHGEVKVRAERVRQRTVEICHLATCSARIESTRFRSGAITAAVARELDQTGSHVVDYTGVDRSFLL